MTEIPNSSKSPYWLKRVQGREIDNAGDADARGSEYSLRSIPAWDPNYLGSSLLAKRIRKTLALVDDRLNTIAVGGVDNALLEQMIVAALAGMNLEGLNQAQVDALIAPVAVEVKDLLSNMASIDGSILKPATVERAVALLKGMYTETVQAAESLNDLVWGLAQKPGGPASVDQAVKAVWDAINALAAEVAAGGGGLLGAGGALDEAAVKALIGATLAATVMPILDDHTTGIADLDTRLKAAQALVANLVNDVAEIVASDGEPLAQKLIDIIGGKPQGGGSIADVAATFAALGEALTGAVGIEEAAVNALIAAALADLDLSSAGLDEAAVITLLETQLTALGPMIQEAIQNNASKLGDRLTLNAKGEADGKVTIQSNNLDGARWKTDLNFELQRDGVLTVNDKRVLTVDDLATAAGLDVDALKAFLQTDVNSANGVIGKELVVIEQRVEAEENLRDTQTKALEQGIQFLITNKADQAQHQGLINALCSAPFVGMTGNVTNNVAKVGIWVTIVKQEIESLEANLGFVFTKTTENKAAIAGVQDRVTALEGAALGGGEGVSQAVIDSLLARLDALEAENVTLKAEVTDLRAFVGEQNQNLTDMHNSDMTQVAEELAKKADKTLVDSHTADINTLAEMHQQLLDWANQTINDVVEYIITEYATKVEVQKVAADLLAVMQALGGSTPAEVNQTFADLSDNIAAAIEQAFEEKTPQILEALSAHLENVLAIFGGGGGAGVTPAQLAAAVTDMVAEVARIYATKQQLTDGLASCAKVNDPNQEITASLVKTRGVHFTINDEVLVPLDFPDYGNRLALINKDTQDLDDAGIVVVHTDLANLVPSADQTTDLGISVLQTANGPVLKTDAGIIQTADQTAHGSRELIRIVNVLNGVVNTVSSRVDTLWNRPGRISIAEADWKPCTITYGATGVYAPPSGSIEAAEVDDVIYLRGGLSTNTFRTSITTGKFLEVAKLPEGMTRPLVAPLIPVWAILTGSSYRIAVIRIGTDGIISVSGPTGAIDAFDATSSFPAGGIAARSGGEEDLSLLDAGGDGSFDSAEERLQALILKTVEDAIKNSDSVDDSAGEI